MKKTLSFFLPLATLFIFGCETVIEVDLPKYTPKLVVNGFFSPDNSWQISLSHSLNILEINGPDLIKDANIKIISETEEVNLKYRNDLGVYLNLLYLPQVDKKYTLIVSAPGYPDISSTSSTPKAAQIISYNLSHYIHDYGDGYQENNIEVTFTLADDSGVKNYYLVELFDKFVRNGVTEYYNHYFSSDNAAIISENPTDGENFSFSGESAVFNDYLFSGEDYSIKLREIYDQGNGTLVLALTTITRELFQYKKSLNRSTNDAIIIFSEPEAQFTNIENGLGIFAGFNTTFVELE